MLAAAGCQSTDTAGVLGVGSDNQAKQKVSQDELRAYCPRVQLREGTSYFSTYAKGGEEDASKLVYQASIGDVTRSCTYGPGTITVNVAVAGRVVPGPAGAAGTITMPIRVAVVQGEEVLYSQLHQYPVQVNAGAGATQFIFNDPNVTVPAASGGIMVYAGYDEGPPKNKPASDDE